MTIKQQTLNKLNNNKPILQKLALSAIDALIDNIDSKKLLFDKQQRDWLFWDLCSWQEQLKALEKELAVAEKTFAQGHEGSQQACEARLQLLKSEYTSLRRQWAREQSMLEKGKLLVAIKQCQINIENTQKQLQEYIDNNANLKEAALALAAELAKNSATLEAAEELAAKYELDDNFTKYVLPCLREYFAHREQAYGYALQYLQAVEYAELPLDNPYFSYCLGYVLAKQGNYSQALEQVKYALSCVPDLPEGHMLLQLLYEKAGRLPEAAVEQAITELLEGREQDGAINR